MKAIWSIIPILLIVAMWYWYTSRDLNAIVTQMGTAVPNDINDLKLVPCPDERVVAIGVMDEPNDIIIKLDPPIATADSVNLTQKYANPLQIWRDEDTHGLTLFHDRAQWVDINDPNCLTDASIRKLAESGRVCKVLGHLWDTSLAAVDPNGTVLWHTDACSVCGTMKEQP